MKFKIEHEIRGRMRVHFYQKQMTVREADILQYYLTNLDCVTSVKIYERTCDAAVCFQGDRERLITAFRKFRYEAVNVPDSYMDQSGRNMNREYWDRLVNRTSF